MGSPCCGPRRKEGTRPDPSGCEPRLSGDGEATTSPLAGCDRVSENPIGARQGEPQSLAARGPDQAADQGKSKGLVALPSACPRRLDVNGPGLGQSPWASAERGHGPSVGAELARPADPRPQSKDPGRHRDRCAERLDNESLSPARLVSAEGWGAQATGVRRGSMGHVQPALGPQPTKP